LTLLCVLGLAFWFSTKLSERFVDTEMDLVPHPHLPRMSEEESV
jgi:hypothetical protein